MEAENVLKFPQKPKRDAKIIEKLNYFVTSRGRYFVHRFMGAIALGSGLAFYSTNTFMIDYYLNFFRAYRNGMPLEVPEELEVLVDQAADCAQLEARQSAHLKSFMVSGFDVMSHGSVNSSYCGWVGIPINYLYRTEMDIDRFNLKIYNGTDWVAIDWNSKHGDLLEKSLILTEDEKLFGITRSVLELRNQNHIHSTLIPSATVLSLYFSAQEINKRYNLFRAPRFGRIIVYGMLSTFALGIYILVTDTIKIRQTAKVEQKLVTMDTDIIEAGIRFYEKTLNKNIAMRELSGKNLYSAKGNEYPGFLRIDAFPLTSRKQFLETELEQRRKKEANATNNAQSDHSTKTNAK